MSHFTQGCHNLNVNIATEQNLRRENKADNL